MITDYIPSGMRWLDSTASKYWDSIGSHLTLNQDGQTVRGLFYRVLPEEDDIPEFSLEEQDVVSKNEPSVEIPVDEPTIDSVIMPSVGVVEDARSFEEESEENQPVVFTYYLTAVLPGNYIVEPALVTLDSQSGTLVATSFQENIEIRARNQ